MRHEQALDLAMAPVGGRAEAAGPSLADVAVTWVNELGSTAAFTFGAGGAVTGTYTSPVSSGGGTVSGPIAGWCDGYVIAWTVLWPTNPPATTAWVGEAVRGPAGTVIETLWHLVTQTPTPGDPTQFWTAIHAGADTFTPQ